MLCIIVPLTVWVGWHSAVNSMVKYHEFWNGWEVEANEYVTTCEKNGSCDYTYDCDPYTHTHSTTSTDSNGSETYPLLNAGPFAINVARSKG